MDYGAVFFITICCAERKTNVLAKDTVWEVLKDSIENYVSTGRWWVHLALAMPDHFHALVSFGPTDPMDKTIKDWKRWTSRNADFKWQHGYFDHRLRAEESFREKASYIRRNPSRAGLAAEENWKFLWTPNAESAR